MINTNDEYTLLGKKQRICLKTITEKRDGEQFNYSEKFKETICYFSYDSDDICGIGTLTLYVKENIVSYEELKIGEKYKLSFCDSYINFVISLNDYNLNLFKELEERENHS